MADRASAFGLDVRNTGSVDAVIESISIRSNQAGSLFTMIEDASVAKTIGVGSHILVGPATFTWETSTSYVIRVTTTTGFYYEAVFTSPSTK